MDARWVITSVLVAASGCFVSYAEPGTCTFGDTRDCICDDGGPGWETCYNDYPAVWGSCVCDMAPVADAGPDRQQSYKTTVIIDGIASHDDDGPTMEFRWQVDAVPPGSAAVLADPTARRTTFLADLPGEYTFTLTVDDTIKTSAPSHITITATDEPPTATLALATINTETGTQVTADGSASSDPNGDPITYAWSVTTRPAGSVAMPSSPTAATTTFTPDVDGTYGLSLVVDDGRVASAPATVLVHAFHHITSLSFHAIDAEYSRALDRIVMVGASPNALYIFDPVTETSTSVALAGVPQAVSVAPDGLHAVVGHNGFLSLVDLQTATLVAQWTVGSDAFDIVYAGDGYAYVFPSTSTTTPYTRSIRLSDGAETVASSGADHEWSLRAKLLPNSTTIYAAETRGTPDYLESFTVASGTVTILNRWQYFGQHAMCGDFWPSDDSAHIFGRCGQVFSASTTLSQDMVYEASLPGVTSGVVHLAQATNPGKVLVIPIPGFMNTTDDEVVRFHTYPSLVFEQAVALPSFLVSGGAYPGHGRFVFIRSDGSRFYVVLTAMTGFGEQNGIVGLPF